MIGARWWPSRVTIVRVIRGGSRRVHDGWRVRVWAWIMVWVEVASG